MRIDLRGQVALVTGGAGGMGRAIAGALREAGASVAITDIDGKALDRAARELGTAGLALVQGDIAEKAEVDAIVESVVAQFGRLDIAVNNAGILYSTRFAEISEEEWCRTININLTGVFLCTQAAARIMVRDRYGRIVNISSSAGKTVSTLGGAHYTASKAGVLGLTRAAAKELAPSGITVNAVCPGLIDTEMARSSSTEERLRAFADSFPIARLGSAREVAETVCFLASPQAAYITGASVDVNGGDLMV